MSLHIQPATASKESIMPKIKVDRRLWLTADKKKIVEDGDPKAAFLFAGEGREVDAEEAKELGYKPKKAAASSEDEGDGLDKLKLDELRALAAERDLSTDGKKAELVERLREAVSGDGDVGAGGEDAGSGTTSDG